MKYSVAATAAFVGAVSASFGNVTTVTIPCEITSTSVVESYVTYCPEATTLIENNKTIIVSTPGTITVTDCPCTRTSVETTVTVTTCPVSNGTPVLPSSIVPVTTAPASQAPTTSAAGNVTVSSSLPVSQGGAAAIGVSGALAGVVAAAAYFL